MSELPSFLEDHISQIPALQLLQNLGYMYLRPQEVWLERKGRLSNMLLEDVLDKQLRKLNRITFKGQQHEFSDANIQDAIRTLKDVPTELGLIRANEKVYDLLSLGKSFEQTIDGSTKSFTLKYIDWQHPENNVFHVTEEFEVEQTASTNTRRPDIVLFVNGIPFVVLECKRPDIKDSLEEAISQHLRNQNSEYIPRLFHYSQLLLGINKNEAQYATTGTPLEFWSHWKERTDVTPEVSRLINKPLTKEQKAKLFAERFAYVRHYFDELEYAGRQVTEQDKALYGLCRPERLIELTYEFILLRDQELRDRFYARFSSFNRTMSVAFSSVKFIGETTEEKLEAYKKDLRFFQKLRISVKQRYAEEIDFREYEAKVQKLINTHVDAKEVLQITPQVNIFDKEKFQAEVERLAAAAAKADTIASRTKKTITEKMEEDPFFYRRFSKILEDVIAAWQEHRLSDAEYLNQVVAIMNAVRDRQGDDVPLELQGHEVAKAFYGKVHDVLSHLKTPVLDARQLATEAALEIDRLILNLKVVDWATNPDAQNEMRNQIDDYLYALKEDHNLEMSFAEMDSIIDDSITIAKARYA